jgi:hypothetical protein
VRRYGHVTVKHSPEAHKLFHLKGKRKGAPKTACSSSVPFTELSASYIDQLFYKKKEEAAKQIMTTLSSSIPRQFGDRLFIESEPFLTGRN